jgi:hypothetical protein
MTMMRDRGYLTPFNRHFPNEVTIVIQDRGFDSLKPTREIRQKTNDDIAAELVISYLDRSFLNDILRCLNDETGEDYTSHEPLAQMEMGLQTGDFVGTLVTNWQQNSPRFVQANLQTLRNGIEGRFAQIGEEVSRRTE